MHEAEPCEVLASSTVKDLVVGSGLRFADRAPTRSAASDGEWRLLCAGALREGAQPHSAAASGSDRRPPRVRQRLGREEHRASVPQCRRPAHDRVRKTSPARTGGAESRAPSKLGEQPRRARMRTCGRRSSAARNVVGEGRQQIGATASIHVARVTLVTAIFTAWTRSSVSRSPGLAKIEIRSPLRIALATRLELGGAGRRSLRSRSSQLRRCAAARGPDRPRDRAAMGRRRTGTHG